MKLAIISDLHFEFRSSKDTIDCINHIMDFNYDILAVAGDIDSRPLMRDWALDEFKKKTKVIYCLGNHDYYNERTIPNMNYETFFSEGIKFSSCTLWTDFNKNPMCEFRAHKSISDFSHIPNFKTTDCSRIYNESISSIKNDQNIDVIMTHFPLCRTSIAERFVDDPLNGYFCNDQENWLANSGAKLHIHGHVHDCFDYMLGDTRVVCNPLGYPHEKKRVTDFSPIIVEL